MVSANVASQSVQNVTTIPTTTGPVGYMLFNDHLAPAEAALLDAVTALKSAGVKDLVLDIRYNGGGYLDIASEAAYMIAGPGPTAGMTFELTQFNSKHPTVDPVTGATIQPEPFLSPDGGLLGVSEPGAAEPGFADGSLCSPGRTPARPARRSSTVSRALASR